jgi:hypothetical protein
MSVSDWYLAALEMVGDYGTLTREQCARLGVHEDDPQPGYYRVPPPKRVLREADDLDEVYVRIWSDGDGCRAEWQGHPMDACAAWTWCCRYPISEERYERGMRDRNRLGAFGAPIPASGIAGAALAQWSK